MFQIPKDPRERIFGLPSSCTDRRRKPETRAAEITVRIASDFADKPLEGIYNPHPAQVENISLGIIDCIVSNVAKHCGKAMARKVKKICLDKDQDIIKFESCDGSLCSVQVIPVLPSGAQELLIVKLRDSNP